VKIAKEVLDKIKYLKRCKMSEGKIKDRWDQITGYNCGTCRYLSPKKDDKGRCRRHAPTMSGYPVVYINNDWCGDHKIGTNPHKGRNS